MAASENPLGPHRRGPDHGRARSQPPLPYFFLERYLPSYEYAWQAFVSAVRSGTPTSPSVADARAPLVIGLGRRALAA